MKKQGITRTGPGEYLFRKTALKRGKKIKFLGGVACAVCGNMYTTAKEAEECSFNDEKRTKRKEYRH